MSQETFKVAISKQYDHDIDTGETSEYYTIEIRSDGADSGIMAIDTVAELAALRDALTDYIAAHDGKPL